MAGLDQIGQVGMFADQSDKGFKGYEQRGYDVSATPAQMLKDYYNALERPSEIDRMRNEAKRYLAEGVGALQQIGASNGLTANEWQNVAGLFGPNPMTGQEGYIAPQNQVNVNAMNQAQAAMMANEFQKQKAQAALQFGTPEALNISAQDMANYNQALPISAMANPMTAAQIEAQDVQNKLSVADEVRKGAVTADQLGITSPTQSLGIRTKGGDVIGAQFTGAATPASRGVMRGKVTNEARQDNLQQQQKVLEQYDKFNTQYTPEKRQVFYDTASSNLDNLLQQDNIRKGGLKINPDDQKALSLLDPKKIVTQGMFDQLSQNLGRTPDGKAVLMALSSVAPLSPEHQKIAEDALIQLQQNGSLNVTQLQSQIDAANKKTEAQAMVLPILSKEAQQAQTEGGFGQNYSPKMSEQELYDKKYHIPLDKGQEQFFTALYGKDALGQLDNASVGAADAYIAKNKLNKTKTEVVNDMFNQVKAIYDKKAKENPDIPKLDESKVRQNIIKQYNSLMGTK